MEKRIIERVGAAHYGLGTFSLKWLLSLKFDHWEVVNKRKLFMSSGTLYWVEHVDP